MSRSDRPLTGQPAPLVLTQGDPAGIGPEITLKAWTCLKDTGPVFAVVGDADLYRSTAAALGLSVPVVSVSSPREAHSVFDRALPVIEQPLAAPVTPGKTDPAHGPGVTGAVETAVSLVVDGQASALVTNPITKAALYGAGFDFPGHTEFLAALTERHTGAPRPLPVMMLASPALRVVPLTIHEALADVPGLVTTDLIIETAQIMGRALHEDFGIEAPRLAIAGLNPHAGEQGTMGREDQEIIAPAVAALQAQGLQVAGPLPADTLFHERARSTYDAALCMYHDQALIPIKTLDFDRGVNVTLGLPFVRTSPDHGTAHDIAGQGIARADNLCAALELAQSLAARRIGRTSAAPSAPTGGAA